MSRPPQEDKIICQSCGCGNYPRAQYCVECEAPLSQLSVTGPFETIRTTGWAYRKAQDRPRSLIVVVGVWLIFGPMALYCLAALLEGLPHIVRGLFGGAGDLLGTLLFTALIGAGLYIPYTIISRTTRGYLQEQQRRRREQDDEDEDDDDGGSFDDDDDDDDEEEK